MNRSDKTENERITDIIENRSPVGPNEMVQGWQNVLKKILTKTAPFMRPGHLITFQMLEDEEKAFFEDIHRKLTVPDVVGSIYIPPSVRHQMMYERSSEDSLVIPEHSPENPPDKGIILGCRIDDLSVVVNALLAKPPFTPAIDVYDNGQLIAGYVYNTIDECIAGFSKVLLVHFFLRLSSGSIASNSECSRYPAFCNLRSRCV